MPLVHLPDVGAVSAFLAARGVRGLATDSRRVGAGEAFVAWPGHALDGRQYVPQALQRGAAACLVEAQGVEGFGFDDAAIAAVPDLKALTGPIAAAFHGDASARLDVVATTGTNGKTSTAWWTAQALAQLGRRAGVIGTLGIGEPPDVQFTGLTTPDPVTLQRALADFAQRGFKACAIEASSIGIVEQRLAGTRIAVALFTNFTQDHLDFHGTMEAYWEAKSALFRWPGLRAAVLNLDDRHGVALAEVLRDQGLDVWGYSRERAARLAVEGLGYVDGGLGFTVLEAGERATVRTTLIGEYNVSNLLAVIGGLRALGVPLAQAAAACSALTPVPGRMQRVPGPDGVPQVVVDYAHSPDALEQALAALRPFAAARGGRLWCVFGCGGNRDSAKRPLMGGIAQRGADRVIVTSDNPRHEAPGAIVAQVVAGLVGAREHVQVIEERREAIRTAVREAAPADVLLVAGKGHEDYQEIAGVKHPFSDLAEAAAALERRA